MSRIIGIDLGTTNSACCYWDEKEGGESKPVFIPNALGKNLTPSAVSLDEKDPETIYVGGIAKSRLLSHPDHSVALFKRYMGIDKKLKIGKKSFRPEELSAMILRNMKQDAEAELNEKITDVVISVPAYFNQSQRKATQKAGEIAGLNVRRIVNEPTAAALAYGLNIEEDKTYIVLDLGGGTFDVSLVDYFDDIVQIKASSGDNRLGGEDFTEALAEHYMKKFGIASTTLSDHEQQRLYNIVEDAKRALTGSEDNVTLDFSFLEKDKNVSLSHREFEEIITPLIESFQKPIMRVLRDAQFNVDDIDDVILVGGATRMPVIKKTVAKIFKRFPLTHLDPDTAIAQGAAIQAGLYQKSDSLKEVVLTDVAPFSLGTSVINERDKDGRQGDLFCPIIERNSTVPISREETFFAVYDKQRKIECEIYQGESRLVKHNHLLGKMTINIPPAEGGEPVIKTRFSYDMNGVLDVDVTSLADGATYSTTIVNSSNELSDDDIAQSKKMLENMKTHPRDMEENKAVLAVAEEAYTLLLHDMRDFMQDEIGLFEDALSTQDETIIAEARERLIDSMEHLGIKAK